MYVEDYIIELIKKKNTRKVGNCPPNRKLHYMIHTHTVFNNKLNNIKYYKNRGIE